MKDTERQAVNNLNNLLQNRRDGFTLQIKSNVDILANGLNNLDQEVKQKEQLLVQKERELESLRANTDNSSKVARNIVNESKGNLDKSKNLLEAGKFSEALKYSDIALYNLENIDNLSLRTIAQANNLYLERKQQYVETAAKRDNLYNSSVVNSVNAFSWVKANPTRDFYTFFREALNIPDKEQKSPDNVRIIKKLYELLPLYVEEAQRANYFYNEYNKYYDVKTKLEQVVNIHNIRAASSKGLKDYEEALKSCEIGLEIEPTSATLYNLKNAILQEKQVVEARKLEEEQLLVIQNQEIEKLKELLARKEVETQKQNKLLTQKGNELASKEKSLIDQHKKQTESLKALLAQKELEHEELLARKELEKEELIIQKEKLLIQKKSELADKSFAKNQVIGELQEDIGLKEKEALYLQIELLKKQLEFKAKEVELKDKASELKDKALLDAMEIVKQKDIVNELQGKLLAFQNLSKHDETLQLELSVIHFKVEESIANKNVNEMEELSKYLSQLIKDTGEKDESLEISKLLALNESPIVYVEENPINNPVEINNNTIISNFIDINHINTTHSVYPSGENSFSIIQDDGSH